MKIKIIAAIGKNNELGKNNSLPMWDLKSDFERFKKLTTGSTVVMGQRTFESLPEKFRPLPNRRNVVLTNDNNFRAESVDIFYSIPELLEHFSKSNKTDNTLWIMGGGSIYKQFMDLTNELHITHVDGEFDADTFFPRIDESVWEKVSEESLLADTKNSHATTYVKYAKRS